MGEPKYRLAYFDVKALGEPIRMIFAHTGTPFIDDRIPWNWPKWQTETKQKFSSSLGQIPVLYWEDKELCNSQIISRFLNKKLGLETDNDWDNARADEVVAMVHDLFILWRTVAFEKDPERKNLMKKTMLDPKFKLCYAKWSEILKEKGSGPFVLGDKVTHADFWLASFVSTWDSPIKTPSGKLPEGTPTLSEDDIYVGMTKDYPLLKKHIEAVENLPGVKEWIAKRPKSHA